MKNNLLILFALIAVFSACKKQPNGGSTPVFFTTTEYSYLGTYDDMGRPNYLVTRDMVSSNLANFVTT